MANIKRNAFKKATKVWTLEEISKYGFNPYSALLQKILYKEEVTEESVEGSDLKKFVKKGDVYYEDTRWTIKFYPSAAQYIWKLHPHSIRLLFYLGGKMMDNLNLCRINKKEELYEKCEYVNEAIHSLEKDKIKGKVYIDEDEEIRKRVARFFRKAMNELLESDILQVSNIKDSYWVNPKIMFKGDTAKIPLKFNDMNNKTLIVKRRGKLYSYGGIDIEKVGKDYLVKDGSGLLCISLEDCKSYIDKI